MGMMSMICVIRCSKNLITLISSLNKDKRGILSNLIHQFKIWTSTMAMLNKNLINPQTIRFQTQKSNQLTNPYSNNLWIPNKNKLFSTNNKTKRTVYIMEESLMKMMIVRMVQILLMMENQQWTMRISGFLDNHQCSSNKTILLMHNRKVFKDIPRITLFIAQA